MEHKVAHTLHRHPAALMYALASASLELIRQRKRALGILTWMSLVSACCEKPAFRETLKDAWSRVDEEEDECTSMSALRGDADDVVIDLCLCRFVDATVNFFRDAAAIGLVVDSTSLRSRTKTMTHNEVLGFSSMDELATSLAVRKSQELARDDFGLIVYCADTLKLPVFLDEDERHSVKTAIRTRNILVHNGGMIDARHVKALGLSPDLIDTTVVITREDLHDWMSLLEACSKRVEAHLEVLWNERFSELATTSDDSPK